MLTSILSHAVFSYLAVGPIDQIIAFDKGVPLVNAIVLGKLCEY